MMPRCRPGGSRMLLAGLLGVMLSAGWLSDARCEGALKARVGVLRLSSSAP